MNQDDTDIIASRAREPLFYRAPAPPNMTPKLYQHAGVEYRIARQHALFGDAPGLGKTAECILTDNAMGFKGGRRLCIVPASLRLNWEREIWMWSTKENVTTYPVLKASDGINDKADFVIISYDLLRNKSIHAAIMDLRWDHLIMDEAHALKDPHGNVRTKAILGWNNRGTDVPGITDVCGHYTMASGTILPNQPSESYNAIRLLNWEAINRVSLAGFMEQYYGMGWGLATGPHTVNRDGVEMTKYGRHRAMVRNQPKNLDDLQHRLRKHVMVRRLKEHVLTELPPKQWHPFPLSLTSAMRAALKHPGWVAAEKLYALDQMAFDGGVPIDGAVSAARRELGEAKAPAVADYCEELLQEVPKIMVGAWHHSVLDYLRERFKKYGCVYMDGSTSAKKKQHAVDTFQEDEGTRIILGQVRPLGEGWTLHTAQDAVLAEPDWTPGKNDQFLDRLHRLGQRGHVIGHIPVVPGTMDERILSTAIEKDQNIHLALDHQ